VSFSGNEHYISGMRFANGESKCGSTVRFGSPLGSRTLQSDNRVVDDGQRIFTARIVGGEYDKITALSCRSAHQRTLAAITVAATAEHGDHAGAGWLYEFAGQGGQVPQCVIGVSVIDNYGEWLATVHALKATGNAGEVSHSFDNGLCLAAERMRSGTGSKDVIYVYSPNQWRTQVR
jgi:hypothetical protein